jgi:site-specific recombinase XerC
MNQLVRLASPAVPAVVTAAGERASTRFLEFFAANIRNPHTRRVYYRTAGEFLTWCAAAGVPSIADVKPVHVATWIEAGTRELAPPSVKQRLAALRHLFDWLVNGQVMPLNPAHSVRGPACRYLWANVGAPKLARCWTASMSRRTWACAIAR